MSPRAGGVAETPLPNAAERIVAQIVRREMRRWVGWVSLALVGVGVVLAPSRTVPNAVQLGSAADTLAVQSELARAI